MKRKRKTKAQIEQERLERERKQAERERAKAVEAARRREKAQRMEWLRKQRSRPRTEMPSAYAGESIHVHKRVLDCFMKQFGKKLNLVSSKVVGGTGGKLVIQYETRYGGRGTLELFDLGPML